MNRSNPRDARHSITVVFGSTGIMMAALGLLAAVAPFMLPTERAQNQARQMLEDVQAWTGEHGAAPATLGDIYGAIPSDPWGNPWKLRQRQGGIVLISHGADGRRGGQGESADIKVGDLASWLQPAAPWYVST